MTLSGQNGSVPFEASSAGETTLRDVLRASTGAAHAALDRTMATLSLGSHDGLAEFLAIHLAARIGIESWLAANAPVDWQPPKQTPLISEDLAKLGIDADRHDGPAFEPGTPSNWTGVAYVVAGSHLGNRLLLAQAEPPVPAHARRFLAGEAMQHYWRRLRAMLAEPVGPQGSEAPVASAKAAFGHFASCAAAMIERRLIAA